MEWMAAFFDDVIEFFSFLWNWFESGLYELLKAFLVTATKAMMYAWLQGLIICVDVAYTVVEELMTETGVIDELQSAWGSIPSEIRGVLSFFNVPQGLTLILSAIPTRFAMKFVPFFGR